MKSLKKINLILVGLILMVLSSCGEYIPDTVVYTEVPTTYVVYDYPRYYGVYRPRYYYRYSYNRIHKRNPNPRIHPRDNRNSKPRKVNPRR
jgi:hypothetical protein